MRSIDVFGRPIVIDNKFISIRDSNTGSVCCAIHLNRRTRDFVCRTNCSKFAVCYGCGSIDVCVNNHATSNCCSTICPDRHIARYHHWIIVRSITNQGRATCVGSHNKVISRYGQITCYISIISRVN